MSLENHLFEDRAERGRNKELKAGMLFAVNCANGTTTTTILIERMICEEVGIGREGNHPMVFTMRDGILSGFELGETIALYESPVDDSAYWESYSEFGRDPIRKVTTPTKEQLA